MPSATTSGVGLRRRNSTSFFGAVFPRIRARAFHLRPLRVPVNPGLRIFYSDVRVAADDLRLFAILLEDHANAGPPSCHHLTAPHWQWSPSFGSSLDQTCRACFEMR